VRVDDGETVQPVFKLPAGTGTNAMEAVRAPSRLVEVIALLAKQDLSPTLEATMKGQSDDRCHFSDRRTVQRQRRLTPSEIVSLAQEYAAGATVNRLADRFGVHRTTVLMHLERQGISRRH